MVPENRKECIILPLSLVKMSVRSVISCSAFHNQHSLKQKLEEKKQQQQKSNLTRHCQNFFYLFRRGDSGRGEDFDQFFGELMESERILQMGHFTG